jgi:hypothetical protein
MTRGRGRDVAALPSRLDAFTAVGAPGQRPVAHRFGHAQIDVEAFAVTDVGSMSATPPTLSCQAGKMAAASWSKSKHHQPAAHLPADQANVGLPIGKPGANLRRPGRLPAERLPNPLRLPLPPGIWRVCSRV